MRQQAASWPNNRAAKVFDCRQSETVDGAANLGGDSLRRLRNSRPDNDAKTILTANIVFFSLRAKRHLLISFFRLGRAFRNRPKARSAAAAAHHAGQAREIGVMGQLRQPMSGEDRRHAFRLPGAELHKETPALAEQRRKLRAKRAIGVEPVNAAVERDEGIVISHLARQSADLAAGDIGRVGDDDVEGPAKSLRP